MYLLSEKFNKIALGAKNDKRIQSIDSVETYVYGIKEEIMHKKEKN